MEPPAQTEASRTLLRSHPPPCLQPVYPRTFILYTSTTLSVLVMSDLSFKICLAYVSTHACVLAVKYSRLTLLFTKRLCHRSSKQTFAVASGLANKSTKNSQNLENILMQSSVQPLLFCSEPTILRLFSPFFRFTGTYTFSVGLIRGSAYILSVHNACLVRILPCPS